MHPSLRLVAFATTRTVAGEPVDDRRSDSSNAIRSSAKPVRDSLPHRVLRPTAAARSRICATTGAALPFDAIVDQLAEAHLSLGKSRASAFGFLTCLFFSSRRWDTPIARVGHPARRRQEAACDDVGIDAARASLARDDALLGQLREMAGHRAPGLSRGGGEGADRRKAPSGAVGEADEVLQRPVQMPAYGAVQVEGDGDERSKGASGVAAQPARKRLILGALCRCTPKGLLNSAEFGKSLDCHVEIFPGLQPVWQTRPSRRVLLYGCWCRGLAQMEPCAQPIPRVPRACPIIASSSTRQAVTLAQSTASDLTRWPAVRCSWESEQ